MVKEGYRVLAKKYHPDKQGGDPELNELKMRLGI